MPPLRASHRKSVFLRLRQRLAPFRPILRKSRQSLGTTSPVSFQDGSFDNFSSPGGKESPGKHCADLHENRMQAVESAFEETPCSSQDNMSCLTSTAFSPPSSNTLKIENDEKGERRIGSCSAHADGLAIDEEQKNTDAIYRRDAKENVTVLCFGKHVITRGGTHPRGISSFDGNDSPVKCEIQIKSEKTAFKETSCTPQRHMGSLPSTDSNPQSNSLELENLENGEMRDRNSSLNGLAVDKQQQNIHEIPQRVARGNDAVLCPGKHILINGGTHSGKIGTIKKVTEKMVLVLLVCGKEVRVMKKNVSVKAVNAPTSETKETQKEVGDEDSHCPESVVTVVRDKKAKRDEDSMSVSIPRTILCTDDMAMDEQQNTVAKENDAVLCFGKPVRITGGTHSGKRGTIKKVTEKMLCVLLVSGKEVRVNKKNVSVIGTDKNPSAEVSRGGMKLRDKSNLDTGMDDCCLSGNDVQFFENMEVIITGGKWAGEGGTISKVTTAMVMVTFANGESTRVKKEFARPKGRAGNTVYPGEEWRVPDADKGGNQFGSRHVMKMRLAHRSTQKAPDTFLAHLFGNRLKVVEIPLNKVEAKAKFDITVEDHGSRYELLCVKIKNDGDAAFMFTKPKCAQLVYVQVSGPGLTPISLQEELLKIGDFQSLNTRKLVARLELFHSTAPKLTIGKFAMFSLHPDHFCMIAEHGNVGCGFICEEFLVHLLGGNTQAKRTMAIQVRVYIPSKGIFKGVLMRKRKPSCAVLLAPSMLKVGPSKVQNADNRAFLAITQAGLHPNSTNTYLDRMLDPAKKPPPKKSFKIKELSEMIPRVWRGLSVPGEIVNGYVKKSAKQNGLQHGYVVGVADPTGLLPSRHIFVTGFGKQEVVHEFFITRSPCVLPNDGRVIRSVTRKPEMMPQEDWNRLNELPFGAVIFGNPDPGHKAMPELIADGDLDGDLFFVCWNRDILQNIKPEDIDDSKSAEDIDGGESSSFCPDWLESAQKMMVDSIAFQQLNFLIGKLFKLQTKVADEAEMFICDPDAIALGRAFKQSLEFGKHGNPIILPKHLHDKIPKDLHKFLTAA